MNEQSKKSNALPILMMILLFGAEVNKILAMRRRNAARAKLRSDSSIDV